MTDTERIIELENILLSYANTINEKLVVTGMSHNNPNVTPKDYILALADGLKYGNWPWVERHSTRGLMNDSSHRFHNTSCPAYAGNEFTCDCGMVK